MDNERSICIGAWIERERMIISLAHDAVLRTNNYKLLDGEQKQVKITEATHALIAFLAHIEKTY
jgi:hypothetical protein